ncbi:hypothetical protein ARMGADRAFT_939446 [Armillaria gallica]|uniref:Fungal pheromone STE3G-protein-coupled receptor n=1 Tax=Armillaria gallica TaxID=47427 RepID=A0A2H3DI50_ARMGA|nr:hypothetical protein ARMGADRAFT_939446 [Armillaria gallica]
MSDSQNGSSLERSIYYGIIFKAILYGIDFYMYFHSVYLFMVAGGSARSHSHGLYVVVGGTLLALLTISTFANIVFAEFMWIDHRDIFGGPLGYLNANSAVWWQTLGTVASQMSFFLGDALLLYRCYIIWDSTFSIIVCPLLLYLGALAMAILLTVQSAIPGSNFFRGKIVDFGVPWASLSVALNAIVTILIIIRILKVRHQLQAALGHNEALSDTIRMYTGVLALLVESVFPYSLFGVVFAITYGKNMDVAPAFTFIWGTFGAMSPQIIIFRVALGQGWTQQMASQLSSIMFTASGDSEQTESTCVVSGAQKEKV